jgi:spermidine synthase
MLYLIVFLSGASVMVLELVGSRIVAPFLGTSIYIWTALIGVILGALSVGYVWGGKIADRTPTYERLGSLFLCAAIATALICPLQHPVLGYLQFSAFDMRLSAVLATCALFVAPSFLLGAVNPLAFRLALVDLKRSGEVAGRLYAVSTLGSIAGTFLAGFVLFSILGGNSVILAVAAVLLLCSVLAAPGKQWLCKVCVLMGIVALHSFSNVRADELATTGWQEFDTSYQRAVVVEERESADSDRIVRRLITDPFGSQSEMYRDNPFELAADYAELYDLAFEFTPNLKTVLMLGGGAYSYPRYFNKRYGDATMDVVEIDPGLTELSRRFFHLPDNDRLRVVHEDGRAFLNRTTHTYDAVFMDAFSAPPSVPFQLTTVEAVSLMSKRTAEDGVVFINIVSGVDGDEGKFLRAEVQTFEAVFPEVRLYQVQPSVGRTTPQSLILVGLKRRRGSKLATTQTSDYFRDLMSREIDLSTVKRDMHVLTDDFAPVEHYLLPTACKMLPTVRASGGMK